MLTINGNNMIGGPRKNYGISGPQKNQKANRKAQIKDKNAEKFEEILEEQTSNVGKKNVKTEILPQAKSDYQLSQQVQFLKGVMDKVEEVPDVRKEKVERLKELVRKGMYDISPDAVAKKMLQNPKVAAKLLAPIKGEGDE